MRFIIFLNIYLIIMAKSTISYIKNLRFIDLKWNYEGQSFYISPRAISLSQAMTND